MKIIKEGNPNKLRQSKIINKEIIIIDCNRCGCKFEIDKFSKDVEYD